MFTDGSIIPGTWNRPDATKPATLTDGNGQPILLTPGHTWVALPQAGSATIVPARPRRPHLPRLTVCAPADDESAWRANAGGVAGVAT